MTSDQDLFSKGLATYQKLVDGNYLTVTIWSMSKPITCFAKFS
jgi:hypothetical protein